MAIPSFSYACVRILRLNGLWGHITSSETFREEERKNAHIDSMKQKILF